MLRLAYDVRGAREAAQAFQTGSRRVLRDLAPRTFRRINDILVRNIRAEAPVKTGKLRKSIRGISQGLLDWSVVVTDDKVHYVINRTKAHPIFPRKKKALYWAGLPHPIAYVKRHPGTRADDFPERGLNKSMPAIDREISKLEEMIAAEFER